MNTIDLALQNTAFAKPAAPAGTNKPALRQAFNDFVGETFYGQMLHAMRQSVGKPAYFNGGRAEEVFTQQLDQMLASPPWPKPRPIGSAPRPVRPAPCRSPYRPRRCRRRYWR